MNDLRPALAPIFDALGTAAIVTPLDGSPVDTSVIWEAPPSATLQSFDPIADFRPKVGIRRDHVPTLPVGSTILAARPPEFPDPRTFTVDAVEDMDPDVYRAEVH